ncbi:hypothetical protein JCM13991_07770 [Thermodesulfovibrio hydrogeniphilus]
MSSHDDRIREEKTKKSNGGREMCGYYIKMSSVFTKLKCHIYVNLLLLGKQSKGRRFYGEKIHFYGGRVEEV